MKAERVQRAIMVAERECLNTKNLFPRDIEVLEAMDYVEMYGDMGAKVTDKVSMDDYTSTLVRGQQFANYDDIEDDDPELPF